jgi:hypothetical protein
MFNVGGLSACASNWTLIPLPVPDTGASADNMIPKFVAPPYQLCTMGVISTVIKLPLRSCVADVSNATSFVLVHEGALSPVIVEADQD